MAAIGLPSTEILIIAAADEFLSGDAADPVDPVWLAIRQEFGLSGTAVNYSHGANDFLAELRAHQLFLEDRDRFWRLHPPLRQREGAFIAGRYHAFSLSGRRVIAFASDLRLNTDGPTMPAMRLFTQLVREAQPRLVVYVGLGAGVLPDHQAGDVEVTPSARFELRGELEGSAVNDQTFGGAWQPDSSLFQGLAFEELREPPLLAPSPHYENVPAPQPPAHRPEVRLEKLPVVTRPLVTDTLFDIPSPDPGDRSYWGDVACSVDMNAAAAAAACEKSVPCAIIIGLATPAIRRFENDYEGSLRRAWADVMIDSFAVPAALNAAKATRRVVERA